MIRSLTYLCCALLLLSCSKDKRFDCFKSNGSYATEARTPGQFTMVRVYDDIDVNIVKGNELKAEVTAGENLLTKIKTKIAKDDESGYYALDITNENTCNFVRGYKKKITITVTTPFLHQVENQGVGTITINSFDQDSLLRLVAESSGDIHIRGNFKDIRTSSHGDGDIYLDGSSDVFYGYMNGTNFLHAEHFAVNHYIFVETLSIGDCYINAGNADQFAYHIWSSGNIYYTGNPLLLQHVGNGGEKGHLVRSN